MTEPDKDTVNGRFEWLRSDIKQFRDEQRDGFGEVYRRLNNLEDEVTKIEAQERPCAEVEQARKDLNAHLNKHHDVSNRLWSVVVRVAVNAILSIGTALAAVWTYFSSFGGDAQ